MARSKYENIQELFDEAFKKIDEYFKKDLAELPITPNKLNELSKSFNEGFKKALIVLWWRYDEAFKKDLMKLSRMFQ